MALSANALKTRRCENVDCQKTFKQIVPPQRFCSKSCQHVKSTPYVLRVVREYRNFCQKYSLAFYATLREITGIRWITLGDLEKTYKDSNAWKMRQCVKLERFIVDFRAGFYDLRENGWYMTTPGGYRGFYRAVRRKEPKQKECPKKLSHCHGGLYPGDCPRNWDECELRKWR